MDLENLFGNASGATWLSDRHSFFECDCPLSCGNKAKITKIGNLHALDHGCPSDQIIAALRKRPAKAAEAESGTNGHVNGHANGNGHVILPEVDIDRWKITLFDFVKPDLATAIAAGIKREALLEELLALLKHGVANRKILRPPSNLNAIEIEEELQAFALKALEAELGEPEPEPYPDRQAIDAFTAYENMKADNRDYSVAGLIRDGCTLVVAALIGSGKSTLAMNFARAWALGVPVLGRQCRQSRTLVVVSPKEYEAWADTIGFWELKGMIFLVESTKAHFGHPEKTVDWFNYTMRKHDCRTFALDTLFDFFGMPPNNNGDPNRMAMNEQTPLLACVREQNYSGLVTGHAPKSEAYAIAARDPEEAFGGHTAWTAQHRMRASIRRKSQGTNAFLTGRGGFGDEGVLKEQLLAFDPDTRLVSLAGDFADYLGVTALPGVLDALRESGWASRSDLEKLTGKGKAWIKAGLREGMRDREGGAPIKRTGENRTTKYALATEADPPEQMSLTKRK